MPSIDLPSVLLDPNVVFLLLNLGLFGLALELLNPGPLVSGALGALALAIALLALSTGVVGPVALSPWLVGAILAATCGYLVVVGRAVRRTRRLAPGTAPLPGAGATAVAVTDLAPTGVIRVGDEEWSALCEAPVAAGETVEVVAREGLRLRVRRAVQLVAAPAAAAALAAPLTRRECEIAGLIARGLTNRQIAETLVIAETTADRHVSNILGKLEFSSRAQVAVWAAERGLDGARRELHTQNAPL